jgi:hypothetical protein
MTVQTNNKKIALRHEFIEIFCALLILLLYCLLSNLWVFEAPFWRYDDPMNLQQVMNSNIKRIFFDAELWQTYGRFLPLTGISFLMDYRLAGLNPSFFYYHHLLVIYLISCATFIWLRSYIGNTRALLAGLLFLAGIPTLIVAHNITLRHYVDGLFFAVIFLIFCRKMENSISHKWIGALFLFLALMEKEIYVIFLLYPFLKKNSLSFFRRLSFMIPAILSTTVFFIWRTIMLKGIGGYGLPVGSAWNNLLTFLSSIGKVFFGEGWLGLFTAGSIGFIIISTMFFYRHRLTLSPILKIIGSAFALLLVFSPAIVIFNIPQKDYSSYSYSGIFFSAFHYHRYLFVSWWAFSCFLMSLPNILAHEDRKIIKATRSFRSEIMLLPVLMAIMFLSLQNQNNHSFHTTISKIENLYHFAIGRGAGGILYLPNNDYLPYIDIQLQSLASVYMRPRLHLGNKNDYTKNKGNYNGWIFDPVCSCFKEIKKD